MSDTGRRFTAVCCREWIVIEPAVWGLRACGLCDTVPTVLRLAA